MEIYLFYLLRVSIAAIILFASYKLFLSRNTFHRLNRIVLLGIFSVSLALPLFTVQLPEVDWFSKQEAAIEILEISTETTTTADILAQFHETQLPSKPFPWLNLLIIAYSAGVIFCLVRYCINLWLLRVIILHSRNVKLNDGTEILVSTKSVSPFSWMSKIVLSEVDFSGENNDIILHEKAHVKYRHSLDLLLADVYCTAFWFNPAAWLLRKELRTIHEYQADAGVLQGRTDLKDYQLLLIRHCVGEHKFSLANNFEYKNLQKRIQMIMKKQSSNRMKWMYGSLIITAILTISILSIEKLHAQKPIKEEQNSPQNKEVHITINEGKSTKDSLSGKTEIKNSITKIVANEKNIKVDFDNNKDLKNPLLIVDSVEVKSIQHINPDNIKSISVLKNKSAIEVYGDKGKNGVILITTKKDKKSSGIVYTTNKLKITETADGSFIDLDKSTVINEEKELLHIVDGIERKTIQDLNPNSIESISVLKDKNSAEIYGDKGKNGVILITTKKSKDVSKLMPSSTPIEKSNERLHIVDGVPVDKKAVDKLPSNEIENVTVLEDTSATALYGSKGANGVILLTTKKGASGKKKNNRILKNGDTAIPGDDEINIDIKGNVKEVVAKNKVTEISSLYTPELYILDGKEITKKQMNAIDPKTIKSITALKDKSATDIYGKKGKNGVVIISSKEHSE